jgi:hypothetical protein
VIDFPSLSPGAHLALHVSKTPDLFAIAGRAVGLELRDTLLVLQKGPATSFVLLFRKPLPSTVVEQVLWTEMGGLNIAGCRVGVEADELIEHSGEDAPFTDAHEGYKRPGRSMYTHKPKERSGPADAAGRWPPNVLLIHGSECQRAGTKQVRGSYLDHDCTSESTSGIYSPMNKARKKGHTDKDGLETVIAWECGPGCPVPLLDGQSGDRTSGGKFVVSSATSRGHQGAVYGKESRGPEQHPTSDVGGASRFFPQFSDGGELDAWLTTLLGKGGLLHHA